MRPDEEARQTNEDKQSVTIAFSRREFLKYAGLAGLTVGATGGLAGLLSACGGEETTTTTAGGSTPTTAAATTTTAGGAVTTAPAGSSTTAAAGGAPTGNLRYVLGELGAELQDPLGASDSNTLYLIYEPLVRYNQKGDLVGWLAESYEQAPDGMKWTFKLRKDVKWTNGDPFNAADVKFTLERAANPDTGKTGWAPVQQLDIASVDTPDDYTVIVNMKQPDVFYGQALTGILIMPAKYFNAVGADTFFRKPIGTGPWIETEYKAGQSVTYEYNPNFWGEQKPVWKNVTLVVAKEEAAAIAMLKSGEADVVSVSMDNAVDLKNQGYELRQTHLTRIPGLFLIGFYLNDGPTSDAKVREAMDIAINRQEICDTFFKGFAEAGAGGWGWAPNAWGFSDVWIKVPFDADKAKSLLAEAGYPDKFKDPVVKLFATTQEDNTWEPNLFEIISGYWEAVGIKTQITPMDQSAMRSQWVAKDPNMMGGVTAWIGNSADFTMAAFRNGWTTKGVNLCGNDPAFDTLFDQMTSELDDTKRLALWQQVQQAAYNMHTILGVCRISQQYAVSKAVGAWTGMDWIAYGFFTGITGMQHA
jgi:peptide/nickel transport system substrate-binding protein